MASKSQSIAVCKSPRRWEDDGVDGGPSSLTILLDWITWWNNYSRWKGDAEGLTKQTLCAEIIDLMKEAKIYH